jgi:hypothetical protein
MVGAGGGRRRWRGPASGASTMARGVEGEGAAARSTAVTANTPGNRPRMVRRGCLAAAFVCGSIQNVAGREGRRRPADTVRARAFRTSSESI